jgi:hypothetical protein
MATYRVYKQLIPAPLNESDPVWAKRQVWVAKLNSTDTVDEYDTEAEAQAKADELAAADPTGRVYKVEAIEPPVVEEEVIEE